MFIQKYFFFVNYFENFVVYRSHLTTVKLTLIFSHKKEVGTIYVFPFIRYVQIVITFYDCCGSRLMWVENTVVRRRNFFYTFGGLSFEIRFARLRPLNMQLYCPLNCVLVTPLLLRDISNNKRSLINTIIVMSITDGSNVQVPSTICQTDVLKLCRFVGTLPRSEATTGSDMSKRNIEWNGDRFRTNNSSCTGRVSRRPERGVRDT